MSHDVDTAGRRYRPALRPVREAKLAPGRKVMPAGWHRRPEIAPGTTVLARRLHQKRRAEQRRTGRMKLNPDVVTQKAYRARVERHWWYMLEAIEGNVQGEAHIDWARAFEQAYAVSAVRH
jgi:hypothetical protein